jgi:aldehyde:ferredoxin oxidoreductase
MTLPREQVVLTVDLTSERISTQQVSPMDVRQFAGGRGVAAKLLYERLAPRIDPLSPDNLLIFSPGALTGTLAPGAARTTIVSKSPATGRYLKCNGGGHWAAEVRYAGYDHILVTGRSERPVYLWIDDDRAEIREAAHLWGQGTRRTEELIKEELGDHEIQTAIVGPAAENGVLFAGIVLSRFNTAARGGIGTVMGSKRLKAIAVRGTKGIPVADASRFQQLSKEVAAEIQTDQTAALLRRWGVLGMMGDLGRAYLVGTRNFRGAIVEEAELLGGQHMAQASYFRAGLACTACAIGCRHFLRNPTTRYGPLADGMPELEAMDALGTQCGVTDTDAVLRASFLGDDLGLDVLSTGLTIAWAMECFEKGVISSKKADGLKLEFGDADLVLELIKRIAWREGALGALLAQGTRRAAAHVGGESWKCSPQARGLEQSTPDARTLKGYALGFAINPRGPDHLAAQPIAELGDTPEARALVKRICGDERYAIPHSTDKKAALVRWHEDCQAVSDALGVCMFLTVGPYMMTPERMAAFLSAAWGIEIDAQELMTVGRRIVTLERCFNVREGAHRGEEEHLPWRMMHEPLQEGPNAGRVTSPQEMDRMLDEYYSLHGWHRGTGRPTEHVLAELGLEEICGRMGE